MHHRSAVTVAASLLSLVLTKAQTTTPAHFTEDAIATSARASAATATPSTFPQLPPLPAAAIPNINLPPVNASTETTSGRFTLTLSTSITNPYAEPYTNATLASALNNTHAVFANASVGAQITTLASNPIPALGTFALNETCLQTWDGMIAYADSGAAQDSGAAPLTFGVWGELTPAQQAGAAVCSFEHDLTSAVVDAVAGCKLSCSATVAGKEMGSMFVCGAGKYAGALQVGEQMSPGCVPVQMVAGGLANAVRRSVQKRGARHAARRMW